MLYNRNHVYYRYLSLPTEAIAEYLKIFSYMFARNSNEEQCNAADKKKLPFNNSPLMLVAGKC